MYLVAFRQLVSVLRPKDTKQTMKKLLCSLALRQRILLYRLPADSRVQRLLLGWLSCSSIVWPGTQLPHFADVTDAL